MHVTHQCRASRSGSNSAEPAEVLDEDDVRCSHA